MPVAGVTSSYHAAPAGVPVVDYLW